MSDDKINTGHRRAQNVFRTARRLLEKRLAKCRRGNSAAPRLAAVSTDCVSIDLLKVSNFIIHTK
jgi:hypothetical protein